MLFQTALKLPFFEKCSPVNVKERVEGLDVASFLGIFNTWWTILNSKQRFLPNILRNAVIYGTKKWVFRSSGRLDWTNTSNCVCIDYYSSCQCCAYRRITGAYQYVITVRLQSDPVERRFSQYRQMSGGKFLNNLREVLNSKRILRCHSLIKDKKVTTGYVAKNDHTVKVTRYYWKLE